MTRRPSRPRINAALLPTWWAAGVRVTCMAEHFGVSPAAVRRMARGLPQRAPGQPTITLEQYRADRRAAIADLIMARVAREAAATRGAMACAEMIDGRARTGLTAWQRGL